MNAHSQKICTCFHKIMEIMNKKIYTISLKMLQKSHTHKKFQVHIPKT